MTGRSFAAALGRTTATDAVLMLASGLLEFHPETTGMPQATEWRWLADLLDSAWGLTGHLDGSAVDDVDVLDTLGYAAMLCRRTAAGTPPTDPFWVEAYESAHAAAAVNRAAGRWPAYWALLAAEDVALDSLDHRPVLAGSEALVSAFTAMAGAACTDSEGRDWIRRAVDELDHPTSPTDVPVRAAVSVGDRS